MIPGWVLLLLQASAILGVLSMALYDLYLSRILGINIRPAEIIRYAWIANTFNNLIGLSGLAGSGIRFLLLARAGVTNSLNAAFSGVLILTVPVGLSILVCLVLVFNFQAVSELPLPIWLSSLTLFAFALFFPLYLLLLRSGFLRRRFAVTVPILTLRNLLALCVISLLDWLLAIAVAWACMLATGSHLPVAVFVTAFTLAAALGILSMIPGGIGVFDTMLIVGLSGYVAVTTPLLAGILVFRLVYYLVPWLIGLYFGSGLLLNRDNVLLAKVARHWEGNALLSLLRLPLGMLSAIGVRVLGYLTFGAGIVLLISAAYPSLIDRLEVLNTYVPLAAVETSHLLSVGIAILLIGLSRGIAEQVHGAYRMAQWLLFFGALFSIVKGIDFEEALIMMLVAFLLRLQREHFYRKSYPFISTRTLLWLLALVLALLGYAWLGGLIHSDLNLYPGFLLDFTPHGESPRYERSLLFALLVALGFLAWSMFRGPGPQLKLPDDNELQRARALLDEFGGSKFAHLIYMRDKYLFFSRSGGSFLSYGRIRDRLIVLGDPCGNEKNFDQLINEFRAYADTYSFEPVFYEITEPHMHRYHDHGFSLFKLGEMAMVLINEFTLLGKRGESIRHSVNRAKRGGVSVSVYEQPLDEATWQALETISTAWLDSCNAAEKGFSLGFFNRQYLSCSPIAIASVAGKPVAFANLMPDYGRRVELSVDLMRHLPNAPHGTMDMIFNELIEYGRTQGYVWINLGMAPLSGVGATRYARLDERVARIAYEYGNRFYNYKGLRAYKEKYHPYWQSTYMAYPVFTPLPGLLFDSAALIAGGYRRILFKGDST